MDLSHAEAVPAPVREQYLAQGLPGVAEVAAYGVPDGETGERLVLAVRFESDGPTAAPI